METGSKELKILSRKNGNSLAVEISDTGKGISEEKIKNIFDPMVTSKVYGPGLGLTFALKIIQDHRGSISVASEPEKGTTFTIKFPVENV
jgi:two-component system, sensor histidine kinase and response regulator